MKLLLNANLGQKALAVLRSEGHEVVTVDEVLGPGAADSEILEWANAHGYILITQDHHFNDLIHRDHKPHAGVVWLRLSTQGGRREADALRQASRKGLLAPNELVTLRETDLV